MAQNLTNYGENAVLNGTTMPATLYAKMHIGAPGEDATNNAAAHTTRVSFTRSTATTGSAANAGDIVFSSLAATETFSHISIWDASSGGNPWWQGALTASVSVNSGGTFTISTGSLTLALD